MEILPIGDRSPDDFRWKVKPTHSPSICLGYARDDDGVERPLIYSIPTQRWLTSERNSFATELPKDEQWIVGKLLKPNLDAYFRAVEGVRSGAVKIIDRDDAE